MQCIHGVRRAGAVRLVTCALILSAGPAWAQNVSVMMFGMPVNSSYSVQNNGVAVTSVNSTAAGALASALSASPGDELSFMPAGAAVPPSAPDSLVATGDDAGCAHLQWHSSPEPDVILYRVYSGGASGVVTDSTTVVGDTTASVCGLTDGTWYFSVRAVNMAGLLSARSNETSASVSNGSAQPPLPPGSVSAVGGGPGCASVSWTPSSDPTVVGYVVDYGRLSVAGGQASAYESSVDAGAQDSLDICGLTDGTWYFAVRSKNYLDMLSAYSAERQVTVTTTAVLVTSFTAHPSGWGVAMEWEIHADQPLEGFRIFRDAVGDADPAVELTRTPLRAGATSYFDISAAGNTDYEYTLMVVASDGSETRSAPVRVHTAPLALALEQNVPNPFNPTTRIAFVLPEATRVVLAVYDVRGRRVATLVDGELPAGRRTASWNGVGDDGRRVASGQYFYRLVAGERTVSRKMMLLK